MAHQAGQGPCSTWCHTHDRKRLSKPADGIPQSGTFMEWGPVVNNNASILAHSSNKWMALMQGMNDRGS